MIVKLALWEFRRHWVSPLPWIVWIATWTLLGLTFTLSLTEIQQDPAVVESYGVTAYMVRTLMGFAAVWGLFVSPVLAMRAISEERRSGTLRLLRGAPLSNTTIVLSKFGAQLLLLLPIWLAAVLPAASLALGTELDWGLVAGAGLALGILLASYAAVSLACSSFTDQSAAAAISAFGILLILWVIYWPGTFDTPLAWLFKHLSPAGHMELALQGTLTLAAAGVWLSTVLAALGAAIWRLNMRPASIRRRLLALLWVAATLGLFVAGLLYPAEWDFTRGQQRALSPQSQTILDRLDEPVAITAFAPPDTELRQSIENFLERYVQLQPDWRWTFVAPQSAPERMRQLGIRDRWALLVESGGRRETCTELTEACFSGALQRLAYEPGWIGFVSGHGERNVQDTGPDGLSNLAVELRRVGFRLAGLNLVAQPVIPDNTHILLLAGPQQALLPGERELIRSFLQRGGHLIWLVDAANNDEDLTDLLNVEVLPGTVLSADYRLLGMPHPAVIAITRYGTVGAFDGMDGNSVLAFAHALRPDPESTWTTQPILFTGPRSWTETGALEGELRFDPDSGEAEGPLPLGVVLSRQQNDSPQYAVVVGDSDFMSNRYWQSGDNRRLALRLFSLLAAKTGDLELPVMDLKDTRLRLPPRGYATLVSLFTLVLPGAIALLGLGVWFRRR
ncbi:MAG: Gldg family protein [Pseudomonadota bacterium]|nr:Gldg family protein [Pseudomonadota bacterium]